VRRESIRLFVQAKVTPQLLLELHKRRPK
jgi:hypothetical protein